jgi:hypothetical protein
MQAHEIHHNQLGRGNDVENAGAGAAIVPDHWSSSYVGAAPHGLCLLSTIYTCGAKK